MLLHTSLATLLLCALPSIACPGHYHHRRGENGTAIPQTYHIQTRIRPAAPTANVAITNVRVWDGEKINEPSTVFVSGQTISDNTTEIDETIDGKNGVLLPGLIDAHAHPGSVKDLETLTSYGVTTVLNQNCQNYEFCSSMRYQTGLSSFYTAGFSAKGPGSSHANNSDTPLYELIWKPSQAPSYVQYVFGNGSDWLKIVSEYNGPDQATQNALVENAHALGHKVNTHAADLESYAMAILSKSDGPQHIPLDGKLNDTLLDLMISQKQYATPTMNVFYDELQIPGAAAALGHPGITFEEGWTFVKNNVAAVYAKGIPILAGTDSTTPYAGESVPFGNSLHYELWHLYQAGLPTAEILRAATINPAIHHALPDRGAIKPGMRADLVLLEPDADPIAKINDTMKISRVWAGGLEYGNVAK